jgi:hypothetical protein
MYEFFTNRNGEWSIVIITVTTQLQFFQKHCKIETTIIEHSISNIKHHTG